MDANLYSLIAAAARGAGDTPVFDEGGEIRLLYSELDDAVAAWAAALHRQGLRPGDRLLVQAEKSIHGALLYLASLRAGLIYVPLNTGYTHAELDYFTPDAERAVVVRDDGLAELAATIRPGEAFETVKRSPEDLAAILYT